jgi:hypothetical protein
MEKTPKTANELEDLIKLRTVQLFGPWPKAMTLFVFEEYAGWNVSISSADTDGNAFYRSQALGAALELQDKFDLTQPAAS